MKKRIGIYGWGIVAPKSPTVDVFEKNLEKPDSWLEPFHGFGPSNFLVGRPEFDFEDYKENRTIKASCPANSQQTRSLCSL